jgi:hypothetical protein
LYIEPPPVGWSVIVRLAVSLVAICSILAMLEDQKG